MVEIVDYAEAMSIKSLSRLCLTCAVTQKYYPLADHKTITYFFLDYSLTSTPVVHIFIR